MLITFEGIDASGKSTQVRRRTANPRGRRGDLLPSAWPLSFPCCVLQEFLSWNESSGRIPAPRGNGTVAPLEFLFVAIARQFRSRGKLAFRIQPKAAAIGNTPVSLAPPKVFPSMKSVGRGGKGSTVNTDR